MSIEQFIQNSQKEDFEKELKVPFSTKEEILSNEQTQEICKSFDKHDEKSYKSMLTASYLFGIQKGFFLSKISMYVQELYF